MAGPEVVINMGGLEGELTPIENRHQDQSEYHDQYVKPKLYHRPWLDILSTFLDPNEKSFAVSKKRRLSFFDVEVIHVLASGKVSPPIKCESKAQFRQAISSASEELRGTLVIANDLSGAMIDALGMQYDLEPEFFACHLLGTESYRMGNWRSPTVRAPNILPDHIKKAPYYTVGFRRPYHIPGGFKEIIELRSTKTNTPRGAQILTGDIPDALVFERISVYKRKGANFGMLNYFITDEAIYSERG